MTLGITLAKPYKGKVQITILPGLKGFQGSVTGVPESIIAS